MIGCLSLIHKSTTFSLLFMICQWKVRQNCCTKARSPRFYPQRCHLYIFFTLHSGRKKKKLKSYARKHQRATANERVNQGTNTHPPTSPRGGRRAVNCNTDFDHQCPSDPPTTKLPPLINCHMPLPFILNK